MSFAPATFEAARAQFKPMKRSPMNRTGKDLKTSPANRIAQRGAVKKKAARRKKPTTGSLKKKAWREFSIFIRTRRADAEGLVACCTCGVKKEWKAMQAGHFIAGRLNSNLFDERGCHPQCSLCNVVKHGNGPMYYKFMRATYGEAVIDELLQQNEVTKKWQPGELQEIFEKYQALNEANQAANDLSVGR